MKNDKDVQRAIENGTIRELFSRPKYRWIPLLYPQVFIREAKVVFMSARKLLGSTSPILGEPDAMLNQLDGGILIIDECDSVKVDWQNYILETAIENQGRDYVQLFRDINSHLRSLQAPLLSLFEQGQYVDSLPWRVQQATKMENMPGTTSYGIRWMSAGIIIRYWNRPVGGRDERSSRIRSQKSSSTRATWTGQI